LDYQLLQHQQFDDLTLQHARATQPNSFPVHDFGPVHLICHIANANEAWKIVLPTQTLSNIVKWYHIVLNHMGITRLWLTISTHFYHPNLHPCIERVVHDCTICQCYKLAGPGYGHLPPRDAQLAPWDEVAVDLIGPWKLNVHGQDLIFNALTCIDPVTNLMELIQIANKSSAHVAMCFENEWLSHYPCPLW